MKRVPSLAASFALLALQWGAVQAAEVGRTAFDLPSAQWELVGAYDHQLTFDSGQFAIPLHTSLYQLPGKSDTPKALLLVTSTEGGHRTSVKWVTETCPPSRPKYLTVDFDSNQLTRKRECLVVNPDFSPAAYFKQNTQVIAAMESKGLKFFRGGYSIRSVVGLQGGTLLRVNLMTQRDFIGLEGHPPQSTDLKDVPAPLVAWGEALHKAVSESALSLGGKLVLPPVAFRDKQE